MAASAIPLKDGITRTLVRNKLIQEYGRIDIPQELKVPLTEQRRAFTGLQYGINPAILPACPVFNDSYEIQGGSDKSPGYMSREIAEVANQLDRPNIYIKQIKRLIMLISKVCQGVRPGQFSVGGMAAIDYRVLMNETDEEKKQVLELIGLWYVEAYQEEFDYRVKLKIYQNRHSHPANIILQQGMARQDIKTVNQIIGIMNVSQNQTILKHSQDNSVIRDIGKYNSTTATPQIICKNSHCLVFFSNKKNPMVTFQTCRIYLIPKMWRWCT